MLKQIDNNSFCDDFVKKIIKKYFNYLLLEKRYSNNTILSYQNDIKDFIEYLHNILKKNIVDKNLCENLSINDFRGWLSYRLENHVNNSNARALSSLRSFFRYLNRENLIANRQIFKIKTPKISKHLPRPVNFEDVKKIIEFLEDYHTEKWQSKRDIAILFIIYGCGLRISEALSISKLMLEGQDNIIISGKGNKQRLVPLLPIIREKIDEYLGLCPFKINNAHPIFLNNAGKIFNRCNYASIIRNICLQLNLSDDITPHSFRHAFATELLEKNVDLRTIQDLLGHATLSSTQKYTKIDRNRLIKNFQKFSNR